MTCKWVYFCEGSYKTECGEVFRVGNKITGNCIAVSNYIFCPKCGGVIR